MNWKKKKIHFWKCIKRNFNTFTANQVEIVQPLKIF